MNIITSAEFSNSHLVSKSWWDVLFLSVYPQPSDVVLAVSTCSKIGRDDCEYYRYCRAAERCSFVEEGEMSKVAGIGLVIPGYLVAAVSVQAQMH